MRIRTKHHRLQHSSPANRVAAWPGRSRPDAAQSALAKPRSRRQPAPRCCRSQSARTGSYRPRPVGQDRRAPLSEIGKDVGATPPKPPADQPKSEDPPLIRTKPAPRQNRGAGPDASRGASAERAKGRWAELSERAAGARPRAASHGGRVRADRRARSWCESGLDQTEFGNMLEMGRLFKSADPKGPAERAAAARRPAR